MTCQNQSKSESENWEFLEQSFCGRQGGHIGPDGSGSFHLQTPFIPSSHVTHWISITITFTIVIIKTDLHIFYIETNTILNMYFHEVKSTARLLTFIARLSFALIKNFPCCRSSRHEDISTLWCFRPYKPYIFWKFVMLAISNALFWPSTTEYQPVPPSTDPVFNDLMV